MLDCKIVYDELARNGIDFFTGVPDSLLKDFNAYVMDHCPRSRHIIAANEGAAIGLACGYHLATRKFALVYMQNSGIGNAVNPLASLADPHVYAIPLLLLIGWRGEPGRMDEPQHVTQGRITPAMLDALEIPYQVLSSNHEDLGAAIASAVEQMKSRSGPYALLVRKDTFARYGPESSAKALAAVSVPSPLAPGTASRGLSREQAIHAIANAISADDAIVSTTGMISRELFEHREAQVQGHGQDFLTVGSMGHASSIALGIALAHPSKNVYCLDGDGAAIMHMGSLAIIGTHGPANLHHIVLNNGVHDSVGAQPTVGMSIRFVDIARACGYRTAQRAQSLQDIIEHLRHVAQGPTFLEVVVNPGHRKDLGRPTTTTHANKDSFMRFLGGS